MVRSTCNDLQEDLGTNQCTADVTVSPAASHTGTSLPENWIRLYRTILQQIFTHSETSDSENMSVCSYPSPFKATHLEPVSVQRFIASHGH